MNIRPIELADAEKCLNMLKQLDQETNNMMYEPGERKTTVEEMKSKIKGIYNSDSIMLIAEGKKKIIGFLSAERGYFNRIKHSAYIVIGILMEYRSKGIGKELFKQLNEWALENNIVRLELTVMIHNTAAIHLYEKMGFKIDGIKGKSVLLDDKYIDEYYMSKII